jgi:hypothetical protein
MNSKGRLHTQHIFEGKLDLVYFLILLFLLVLVLAGFIIWFGPLSEQLLWSLFFPFKENDHDGCIKSGM